MHSRESIYVDIQLRRNQQHVNSLYLCIGLQHILNAALLLSVHLRQQPPTLACKVSGQNIFQIRRSF